MSSFRLSLSILCIVTVFNNYVLSTDDTLLLLESCRDVNCWTVSDTPDQPLLPCRLTIMQDCLNMTLDTEVPDWPLPNNSSIELTDRPVQTMTHGCQTSYTIKINLPQQPSLSALMSYRLAVVWTEAPPGGDIINGYKECLRLDFDTSYLTSDGLGAAEPLPDPLTIELPCFKSLMAHIQLTFMLHWFPAAEGDLFALRGYTTLPWVSVISDPNRCAISTESTSTSTRVPLHEYSTTTQPTPKTDSSKTNGSDDKTVGFAVAIAVVCTILVFAAAVFIFILCRRFGNQRLKEVPKYPKDPYKLEEFQETDSVYSCPDHCHDNSTASVACDACLRASMRRKEALGYSNNTVLTIEKLPNKNMDESLGIHSLSSSNDGSKVELKPSMVGVKECEGTEVGGIYYLNKGIEVDGNKDSGVDAVSFMSV